MAGAVLVLGASGNLARALVRLGEADVTAMGRAELDLLDAAAVRAALRAHAPRAVINAAAYTAVDKAETEPEAAFALNGAAPGALAQACEAADLPLVHVSTDYVFDGAKPSPYVETDATGPLGVYGRSKLAGEDAVLASGARAAILRTSWVFSADGANFVRTMLRLAQSRDELGVVADQHGRPTLADDLARACLRAAQALVDREPNAGGVFHYAGADDATWAQFAQAIFEGARARGWKSAQVRPITTADYPTPARRPANSRLDTTKFAEAFGLAPRPWRLALDDCLNQIG